MIEALDAEFKEFVIASIAELQADKNQWKIVFASDYDLETELNPARPSPALIHGTDLCKSIFNIENTSTSQRDCLNSNNRFRGKGCGN